MTSSEFPVTAVKVPVLCNLMTNTQKRVLDHITSRDTRVIRAYLGVIDHHQHQLLVGTRSEHVDSSKLAMLTLTASRGKAQRPNVEHDFKKAFPNISVNELQECRDTAIALWQSYLATTGRKPLKSNKRTSKKLPRFIFLHRFELVCAPNLSIKHWLRVRNSLHSARTGRRVHDQLMIPLGTSSYHLSMLAKGETKSVRLVKDSSRKWWVVFSTRVTPPLREETPRPPAVLGIDLGIKKAVCSVLLTQKGLKDVRFWTQDEKVSHILRYDSLVASLQQRRDELSNRTCDASKVKRRLHMIGNKRERLSLDHDRKLVDMLARYISELSQRYDLSVAVGRLKGIRNAARKGSFTSQSFRGAIHRWSFYRITNGLKHRLAVDGFSSQRICSVCESWTSIKCHKCGHVGLRPKQAYFLCPACGYRDNADKNAAINIARRLIMLIPSLRDETVGLGTWLLPFERVSPKTGKATRSNQMSPLLQRSPASYKEKSVADCDSQASLMEPENSTDPAMVRTVEISSAAETTGSHSMKKQRKETPSRRRGDTPVRSSKGHVTAQGGSSVLVGDNGRDKSGTQKSKVKREFPSPSDSELRSPDASEGIRSGILHDNQMPHIIPTGQVGSRNKVSAAQCKEQVGAERGS